MPRDSQKTRQINDWAVGHTADKEWLAIRLGGHQPLLLSVDQALILGEALVSEARALLPAMKQSD